MKTDVVIVGGGPGGAAAAMFLLKEGFKPIIELTDAFAGRIYETEHQPSDAIIQFRKMLKRERDYDHPDDYSIPIGSRYHPERAPLWEPDSPVGTTEDWLAEAASSRQEFADVN